MIKKAILLLVLGLLISFLNIHSQIITQIGAAINGNGTYDYFGNSMSMNADGTIIAIGAPSAWYNGDVRVYKNNAGTWEQIGSDISDPNKNTGYSVSLSADGSIVAVGIPGSGNSIPGIVRVYRNNSGSWQQIGTDINGSDYGDYLGSSVSLSADGSIVAVGATEQGYGGESRGHGYVRIFKNNAGTWEQIGGDIKGDRANVISAGSISLNSDGSVVAIGDLYGGATYSGQVRIFRNNSGVWQQVGASLVGTGYHSYYGNSVSLSTDGSVVALGAKGFNMGYGLVRIFKNNDGTWQQIGSDINGEYYTDEFGYSVDLSGNGTVLAIGARTNDGNLYGKVKVYKNVSGTWAQIGPTITGVAQYDEACRVSLNEDGSVLAIGAIYNDVAEDNAGHVRMFHVCQVKSPVPVNENLADVTGVCSATVSAIPTATDDCGNTINGSTTDSLTYKTEGTHTVTWTYTDAIGNKTTQTQKVILDDVTAPVPNASVSLPDITSECYLNEFDTIPSATDACKGTINGVSDATLPIRALGKTVVTWTYDDGNGNTSTQTQNVIITADATKPLPDSVSLHDITKECYLKADEITAPTATDLCTGKISGVSNISSWPITSSTTITWTYDDGNGNTSSQTQNVIIIADATKPVPDSVSLHAITKECYLKADEIKAPTATDLCAGKLSGVSNISSWPITSSTIITWTYDDGNGNNSTQIQNVIITSDVSIPMPDVISLQDLTAECKLTQITAPTATDRCAGAITGTTTTTLPITNLGTTVVTWTYDDGNGHTSTQLQNILIQDLEKPSMNCIGNQTINLQAGKTSYTVSGTEFDPKAQFDNCEVAGVTNNFNNSSSLAGAELPLGTTTIVWTIKDKAGNESLCNFDVHLNLYNGIETFEESGILIYPNPTKGKVNLNFNGNKVEALRICDLSGRELIKKMDVSQTETIDISCLSIGLYIINIQTNSNLFTKKIMKE